MTRDPANCIHGHIGTRYTPPSGNPRCSACDKERERRRRAEGKTIRPPRREPQPDIRTLPPGRAEWIQKAACRPSDPADFDIVANISSTPPPEKRITAMWDQGRICEACPVVAQCARDALAGADIGIVRGGVPIVANADLAWRRMERGALKAMSESDDPAETRRVWQVAAHRTAAKRRTEKSAA